MVEKRNEEKEEPEVKTEEEPKKDVKSVKEVKEQTQDIVEPEPVKSSVVKEKVIRLPVNKSKDIKTENINSNEETVSKPEVVKSDDKPSKPVVIVPEVQNLLGFTYQLFPLAKNKILIRLENILDRFDKTNSETKYFNLK